MSGHLECVFQALDAGRIIFFQKNPRNIVMVFQNILSSFLRKNCKKIKHTIQIFLFEMM